MAARIRYTQEEYLSYIKFTRKPHLLVEGKDDERFFMFLRDDYMKLSGNDDWLEVEIESAESILDGANGNRKKIEEIGNSISEKEYANKFMGFVDREFRDFEFETKVEDKINSQKEIGRLVWSRGHSIENYLFDYDIVHNPLREFSTTISYGEALELLKIQFENVLRFACIFSLAAYEGELISASQGTIFWDILKIEDNKICLDLHMWEKSAKKKKLDKARIELFKEKYLKWELIVEKSNSDVVRWVTHGHIGLKVIWAAYGYCIFAVSKSDDAKKDVSNVLKANESTRFNACVNSWANSNLGSISDSPLICFEKLLE